MPLSLASWVNALENHPEIHAPSGMLFRLLDAQERELRRNRSDEAKKAFYGYRLAECDLGVVSVEDLFELREMCTFALYQHLSRRYTKVADLGANVGLHSIFMSGLGWQVDAYEPDPEHLRALRANLVSSGATTVRVVEAAADTNSGTATFVRVEDNSTSSHLLGRKESAYGRLSEITVRTIDFRMQMSSYDFVKMDVEGSEGNLICSTDQSDWRATDVLCEVGTESLAADIYAHCSALGLSMYGQNQGWRPIRSCDQMPKHYAEGHLFITSNEAPFAN